MVYLFGSVRRGIGIFTPGHCGFVARSCRLPGVLFPPVLFQQLDQFLLVHRALPWYGYIIIRINTHIDRITKNILFL